MTSEQQGCGFSTSLNILFFTGISLALTNLGLILSRTFGNEESYSNSFVTSTERCSIKTASKPSFKYAATTSSIRSAGGIPMSS